MTKQEQDMKRQLQFFEKQQREEKKRQEEYVQNQEISARSWKAEYEKMYYFVECTKIRPEFERLNEEMRLKAEEAKKAREAQVAQPDSIEAVTAEQPEEVKEEA